MDIKQVQYFLMLVEKGSYSSAAGELYIGQSTLSKEIMALEKELGFALFDRSRRKIALTPAGGAYLVHARSINAAYLAMQTDLAQYRTDPVLSITSIPVIAQYNITGYIAQFKQAYPDIQLTVDEREAFIILPALNNHQYTLAFMRDYQLDPEMYSCAEIAGDKLVLVVSANHRLSERESVSLVELADENFIMFDKGTTVHELTVDACRKAGFEPRILYTSLRVESVLGMVASNSGVALVMEKIFRYDPAPELKAVPLTETVSSRLVLAWLKNKKLNRPARLFVDFMLKRTQQD